MSRPPTPTAASLRQDIKDWWDGRSVAAISRSMFDSFIDRAEREAAATERRLTVEPLRRIQELQPNALAYIRQHGFVMDVVGPLTDDASELDRWKVLAFSLYTDLCQAESEARSILDDLATAAVDEEEGK